MTDRTEQDDRTFDPTPLRLAEAARRGQVPRSTELTGVLVMLGALGVLAMVGPVLLKALAIMLGAMLDRPACKGDGGWVVASAGSLWSVLWPVGALAAGVFVLAAGVGFLQVGWPRSAERVQFNWRRVSPSEGWRRLRSGRTGMRLAMMLARVAAVGAALYFVLRGATPEIAVASRISADAMASQAGDLVWRLAWRSGVALLVLGVLDYLYQRWQHRRDLRISHRQLREDLRQMEGDPNVRVRRDAMRKQHG